MILGLDTFMCKPFETPQSALYNISYLEVKRSVIDDLHIRSIVTDCTEKSEWDNSTILHAKFEGDLEAGSISMRENKIVKLRLKRRETNSPFFRTVAEFPFDQQIMTKSYEFDDYEPRGNIPYEWVVTPVDEAGIEGSITSGFDTLEFEGWWIIDLDHTDKYCFQFIYNMDTVGISTDQDRNVMSTFSRYPFVRYGAKHVKQGALQSLIVDDGISIIRQIQKLDEMLLQHKSYLLKDGNGRRYIVDISNPTEQTYEAINEIEKLTIDWYEVGEIVD